jgi:hypothetical protein
MSGTLPLPTAVALVAAWLLGAAVSAAACWYVLVFGLDEFNRGYGRSGWFALNLYLSGLAAVAGGLGYAVASLLRNAPRSLARACLAGVVFTGAELALASLMEQAFPDRDLLVPRFVAALALGALSSLVQRGRTP